VFFQIPTTKLFHAEWVNHLTDAGSFQLPTQKKFGLAWVGLGLAHPALHRRNPFVMLIFITHKNDASGEIVTKQNGASF
jgi:hypothetical protein